MNPGESSENHRFRERAEAAKIRAVILDYGEVLCHHPTAEDRKLPGHLIMQLRLFLQTGAGDRTPEGLGRFLRLPLLSQ